MNTLANEIILYQPENSTQLEVRVENETVWLTQNQIANLFGVKQPAISKHLKNIFLSGELNENSVYSILEYTATDGKAYQTGFYSLDAILSVGYRVNSRNATLFRIWANRILKDYLLKGYVVDQRIDRLERKIVEHDQKFDLLIKASLPSREGIFFDGQIFDAYAFVSGLIKAAKKDITLIDNYIDESVLLLLSKRESGVTATIYTAQISPELQLDLQRHNAQYPPVEVKKFSKAHDRFLLVDNTVYHIGASLKDLGRRWFAFSKMELAANILLQNIT
ncbi:MAG: virulence RhuM family protein [Prevotellaceae bacterium]|jgi:predicted XRE-type DNA-binding protein|nr:virulence RhuM family protein [Prevotellaceae bacterium]